MGNMKETHNVFLKFSFQKHPFVSMGKTLYKSQNMSRNGFFWGKPISRQVLCFQKGFSHENTKKNSERKIIETCNVFLKCFL